MDEELIQAVPGAEKLRNWFGYFPDFHDAELTRLSIADDRPSVLEIRAHHLTDRLDNNGFYICEKQVHVIVTLSEVSQVQLKDLHVPGYPGKSSIINYLSINRSGREFRIRWDSSVGVCGTITSGSIGIEFEPDSRAK